MHITLSRRSRKGFALIFVLLIGALLMIPVLMVLSSAAPRRSNVTGEAIADRILSVSDGTVEKLLAQVNTFPDLSAMDSTIKEGLANIGTYYTNYPPQDLFVVKRDAVKYVLGYLLAGVNGGAVYQPTLNDNPATHLQSDKTSYPGAGSTSSGSIWDIEDNVTTYLYDLESQRYYAVWDTSANPSKIAAVGVTGINGDIRTKAIKNLSTGEIRAGISLWDSAYGTDNRWIEADTNTQYVDNGTNQPESTKFEMRVSSYFLTNLSAKNIVRTVLAEATLKATDASLSSSGSGGSGASGPFAYAAWSGKGLIMNGVHTVQSGHINPSTNQIVYDGKSGQGSLYADGQIILNGNNTIYGNIVTSLPSGNSSIVANGTLKLGNSSQMIYGQKETLPDFAVGTESSVKSTAMAASLPYTGNYVSNASNSTISVDGGGVKYYVSGNVSLTGSGNTIKFYPVDNTSGPKVDWYIGGNLSINGDTVLDFGDTPGVVWVNGDVTFNGNLTIKGSGTIVTNRRVTFNGYSKAVSTNPQSKLAIISEGTNSNGGIILNGNNTMYGIFYAPHSDIILNGTGSVFGSIVAGGYITSNVQGVIVNGNQNITYDTGIGSGSGGPVLPTTGGVTVNGVSFAAKALYRLSWREIISNTVNVQNIQKLSPVFNFANPS